jgi:hypothetical protein
MKTYGGVDAQIHVFLTSAIDPPRYPLDRRLGGPQSQPGQYEGVETLDIAGI